MNITTKRQFIQAVAKRWREQYFPFSKWGQDKADIAEKLDAMNLNTATEDDVERAIGNKSWTRMKCDECGEEVEALVQLGQEPDYESRTAYLCPSCVKRAFDLSNNSVSNDVAL